MTEKGKRHSYHRSDLIDSIVKMRIEEGLSRTIILDKLKTEYKLSDSYSYQLVREAADEFNQRAIVNFGNELSQDIERFEMNYTNALKEGNRKLAVEILKEICKLKGHYIQRIDLNANIEFNAKFPGLDENK